MIDDDDSDDGKQELWQGRGQVIFMGEEVAELFNWPQNPPTMTVIDKDGNEVDLSRP